MIFPRERFVDYNFEHPRLLNELKPVRTLEVIHTDSEPTFMMKSVYDEARRTLNPRVIIKPLPDTAGDEDSGIADPTASDMHTADTSHH